MPCCSISLTAALAGMLVKTIFPPGCFVKSQDVDKIKRVEKGSKPDTAFEKTFMASKSCHGTDLETYFLVQYVDCLTWKAK